MFQKRDSQFGVYQINILPSYVSIGRQIHTYEIDLIMISETGIYVFESKNYSGWIFGDEKQRYWTQIL